MKKWLESLPKFIIGPAAVIVGILYFVIQDPPKTVCDTQFEIFKKEQSKYIFGYTKNGITIPAGMQKDIKTCQEGNSPGACYDWLQGLKTTLHGSRNLPQECGSRLGELAPYGTWMDQSLFLFSQISWNDTNAVRADFFNWLESDDIDIFCRLKREYIRLKGEQAYNNAQMALLNQLVTLKKIPAKDVWPRTVLSYKCRMY